LKRSGASRCGEASAITPNADGWRALAEAEHARARGEARPEGWADAAATWNKLERPGSAEGKQEMEQILGLTPREAEVLKLIARGYTNREIAEALVISVKTAGVHVSNILRKLDAHNRVEAAAIAHRFSN
jgi:DNA-binding NarL/FixJ family response regulator